MSKSTLTRRALVASTAALPAAAALGLPVAQAAAEPDPIFALIEQHREAAIRQMRVSRVAFNMDYDDPAKEAADEAEDRAREVRHETELALMNTRPATMDGIIALLAYVDDLHIGTVVLLPEDPNNWYINAEQLGNWEDEQIVDNYNEEPVKLPFAFWIMRNVRAAIEQMAGAQS